MTKTFVVLGSPQFATRIANGLRALGIDVELDRERDVYFIREDD